MIGTILKYSDVELAVPEWAKWLAFDENGGAWVYSEKPITEDSFWCWNTAIDAGRSVFMGAVIGKGFLEPPEEGPWEEQLYKLVED